MTAKTCPACGDPEHDGLICRLCIGDLRHDLHALPDLMRELATTITRQSQSGGDGARKGREEPLPYDWSAAHTRDDVVNTVGTWIRVLDLGDTVSLGVTMTAWCGWLVERTERIRSHVAGAELVDELRYSVQQVRIAIDTPPPSAFYGRCEICGRDLLGRPDATEVTCRYCERGGVSATYDAASRRRGLWQTAPEQLVTRRTALDALPTWGLIVAPATFRSWLHRGALIAEQQHDGRVVYRLGDVLELARRVGNGTA